MPRVERRRLIAAAIGLAAAASFSGLAAPVAAQDQPVLVFAAASLKNALDAVNADWQRQAGSKATVSYAASPALARQIEAGAPADVFISADLDWMDYVAQKKLIRPETRTNLLGNRLVLIAPKSSTASIQIGPNFALAAALGSGRLAMANTDAVPAGKYGKAALLALGVWSSVADKVAQAENVRAALLLVERGEAPFGVVYQTDAAADLNVTVLDRFPESSHPPIVYPIAILASSKYSSAAAYLAHLKSQAAKAQFEKHGFTVQE